METKITRQRCIREAEEEAEHEEERETHLAELSVDPILNKTCAIPNETLTIDLKDETVASESVIARLQSKSQIFPRDVVLHPAWRTFR